VIQERCDVAVVGAGLVGLSLAYELASQGAAVTVVDAAHPGRATDAGAGILSPATSHDTDSALWAFLQQAGAHYPDLLRRLEADGADVAATGYGVCGLLSLGLREHEDSWFAPFADITLRRSAGAVAEISPAEARALFPPLGPVHRALYCTSSARVDGRAMAAALRGAAAARGVAFLSGLVHGIAAGVDGGAGGGRHVTSVEVEGQHNVECAALAVAGGAWTAAMGEWLGHALPVRPTKGQIVHLGVDAATGGWPIAQPLLTHYLVPWPGGRVACGGTFEPAAGYSVHATAAGLHELLRECLGVAPGLADATYGETRVGLRPTSADDRALVGPLPGWSNVWVATGHGANGLLQGPYSARALAHLMAGPAAPGDEVPLPPSFNPARFG
jgi:D-amino-acid dehydrogenase